MTSTVVGIEAAIETITESCPVYTTYITTEVETNEIVETLTDVSLATSVVWETETETETITVNERRKRFLENAAAIEQRQQRRRQQQPRTTPRIAVGNIPDLGRLARPLERRGLLVGRTDTSTVTEWEESTTTQWDTTTECEYYTEASYDTVYTTVDATVTTCMTSSFWFSFKYSGLADNVL